ncbi:unnamed protein product [Symbiodinium natans]|uniref:HYR domain-containing protein n=1 Tax=Symbiodinium natans TaxID=878477 RepID=A0A812RRJ8_9DINO|nr:unnamed protein product [Symbiodinium natans]
MAMLKLLLAWCAVRLSSAALTCGAPAPDDGGSPFQNQANMEQQGWDLCNIGPPPDDRKFADDGAGGFSGRRSGSEPGSVSLTLRGNGLFTLVWGNDGPGDAEPVTLELRQGDGSLVFVQTLTGNGARETSANEAFEDGYVIKLSEVSATIFIESISFSSCDEPIVCPADQTEDPQPGGVSSTWSVTSWPSLPGAICSPGGAGTPGSPAGGTVLSDFTASFDAASTTTVECFAGVDAACNFTVTVGEPSLTCPSDITVEAESDAGAAVTFPDPSATNGFGFNCSSKSGDTFPVGSSAVLCYLTDLSEISCTFTVTVTIPADAKTLCDKLTYLDATLLGKSAKEVWKLCKKKELIKDFGLNDLSGPTVPDKSPAASVRSALVAAACALVALLVCALARSIVKGRLGNGRVQPSPLAVDRVGSEDEELIGT